MAKGYHNRKPEFWRSFPPEREEIVGGTKSFPGWKIRRRDIPDYLTPDLYDCLDLFNCFELFGLPFAGGWAEQPAHVIDILSALKEEARKLNDR